MFTSLLLQNFRSYKDGQFEFSGGVTIIVGPNGSGKTSLIEALLFVCTGGSYKSMDDDVVRTGSGWTRIDAYLTDDNKRTVKIQKDEAYANTTKTFVINGVSKQRLILASKIPTVLFEPQHMNILTGEPSGRRDFLDALLAGSKQGYSQNLKNYRRALAQRNSLLKRPSPPRHDELFVWDLRLSELGGAVHTARRNLLADFSEHIQKTYKSLSSKNDAVGLLYISDKSDGDYTEVMLKRLTENIHKDLERGFTGVGPHRDDFMLTIHGMDARKSASRGESRSLLLSLKLLEIKELEKARNQKPIILLDDVFSELDGARRQALAGALKDYQTFITTTDADLVVEHFSDKAQIIALQ